MLQFKTKKTNYLRLYIVIIMSLLLTPFEFIFAQIQIKPPVSDEVQKLFLKAVEANDVEKVKLFLQNGASANYYESRTVWWDAKNNYRVGHGGGLTKAQVSSDPLIHAILYQANDVAAFLIQYDRSVLFPRPITYNKESGLNAMSMPTYQKTIAYVVTPFQIAYGEKNEKMVDLILREIFNPTGGDPKLNEAIKKATLESNILDIALKNGDLNMAEKIKGYGFQEKQSDLDGSLYKAVSDCSKYDFCKTLLDKGANPNYKDRFQENLSFPEVITPVLIKAAKSGCVEIQKLLIEKGADINAIQTSKGIMDGYNSWNALSINIQKPNNLEFITWLVEHGANVNADLRNGGEKESILKRSNEEYKEFLVLHGAR